MSDYKEIYAGESKSFKQRCTWIFFIRSHVEYNITDMADVCR